MDSSGEEIVVDVDKYAIMRRLQIHARDLRILDPLLSYPSTILGRETAIVLNLEHIKAIITAHEVLLLDDDDVVPIVQDLRRRLKPLDISEEKEEEDADESPFEFRALEAALEAICSYLSARTIELESAVYPALDRLTSKISGPNLDRVRKLKTQLTKLSGRVHKVRDELEQLLDDDDDMAHLYLSRKLAAKTTAVCGGVEEIEMLLEAYFVQIDETVNRLNRVREYIESTNDYIDIQLDSRRNKLIQLEVWVSAATVCMAIYSLVAAIFGMNIPYSWTDDHGYMFKWVVIDTGVLCAVLFVVIMCYARYRGLIGSYFYNGSYCR